MITQSYKYFYKRFLQYVALFSSLNYYFLSKNAKAPEAGKPASGAIKLKCQNELLYFSKLSQSSKKSYMFTVRIPYSS